MRARYYFILFSIMPGQTEADTIILSIKTKIIPAMISTWLYSGTSLEPFTAKESTAKIITSTSEETTLAIKAYFPLFSEILSMRSSPPLFYPASLHQQRIGRNRYRTHSHECCSQFGSDNYLADERIKYSCCKRNSNTIVSQSPE